MMREPKPMIGVIVSDRRRRVVGSPFFVPNKQQAKATIDAAEAKRGRRAAKRKGVPDAKA